MMWHDIVDKPSKSIDKYTHFACRPNYIIKFDAISQGVISNMLLSHSGMSEHDGLSNIIYMSDKKP